MSEIFTLEIDGEFIGYIISVTEYTEGLSFGPYNHRNKQIIKITVDSPLSNIKKEVLRNKVGNEIMLSIPIEHNLNVMFDCLDLLDGELVVSVSREITAWVKTGPE